MRKLELLVEGGGGSSVEYDKINLNSITTADRDHINLGNSITSGARTIEFDIELTANQVNNHNVFSRYASGGINRVDISFHTGNKLKISCYDGSIWKSHLSSHVLPLNTKVTVTVRLDSTEGCRFFYDGVPEALVTASMNIALVPHSDNLYIGGLHALPSLGRYVQVKVDNVKIWNTSRSNLEISNGVNVILDGTEVGLIESFPFLNETGTTTNGVKGTIGTISTLNAGGVTHVNNVIREQYFVAVPSLPLQTFEFDLFEDEPISVTRKGIDINKLSDRSSGTTNSFKLPLTANNNRIFDLLEVDGNTSNFPYELNYVRYTEDSVEIIPKGRINVNSITDAYNIDITHGMNGLFDLLRGKFLRDNFDISALPSSQTVSSIGIDFYNNVVNQLSTGITIPLMDTAGFNPIPDYAQVPSIFIEPAINNIFSNAGYSLTNNGVDLTDLIFSGSNGIDASELNESIKGLLVAKAETPTKEYVLFEHKVTVPSVWNFENLFLTMTNNIGSPGTSFKIFNNTTLHYNVPSIQLVPSFSSAFLVSFSVAKGDVIKVVIETTGTFPDSLNIDYNLEASRPVSTYFDMDIILKDIYSTQFITSVFQMFNMNFEVNESDKEVEIYNVNDVFDNAANGTSSIIDLSQYFDKVIKKTFKNSYGQQNNFKFKYLSGELEHSNGTITANNINAEKTMINSNLNGTINESTLAFTQFNSVLATIPNAFDGLKGNDIGYRVNKLVRHSSVECQFINGFGFVSLLTSDFSTTSSYGLDWQSLINDNYSNIRDNVLNRYVEYEVSMNTPSYINRDFSFKDKVFIQSLNSNFVVTEITTKPDGTSVWKLIKLN